MKKSTKKLKLSRETLSALTLKQNNPVIGMVAGGDTLLICPLPATSDTVRVCCA
jgi:hypothetical protein